MEDKRIQDALDAMSLVNVLSSTGQVSLDTTQRQAIQQGLYDVLVRTGTTYLGAWSWNAVMWVYEDLLPAGGLRVVRTRSSS